MCSLFRFKSWGDEQEALEVQDGIARLSTRETEIFALPADGMSIKEIAGLTKTSC